MRLMKQSVFSRFVCVSLVAGHLALASGCATLAHRSAVSGQHVPATEYCTGSGDTCPWLWADAGLLLLGVVPGVIALIVDFGSGAWQHTHQRRVRQARDGISSAHTLFPPTHRAG